MDADNNGASPRLTMADLAELAGVAKITVSRALKDSPAVRPEVRERVQALAEKHGYRLNTAARNLRLMRAHSITAVIEMDPSQERPMSEPIVLMAIGGLLQELTSNGYRLTLTTRSQLEISPALDTDGLILLGQGANGWAMERIRSLGLPVVVWGMPLEADADLVCVASDNLEGGRLVGAHLASRGRKRILYLGDPAHPEVAARIAGVEAAVAAGGGEILNAPCAFSFQAGRMETAKMLSANARFDAIAAASDTIALGAIAALREAGLRVPEDVSVVGYDDTEAGLTSIRQEWVAGGELLARKLFGLLAGRAEQSALLPVTLMVRSSG